MVDDEFSERDEGEKHSPAEQEQEHGVGELRHYVPQDLLDVSFPVAVRGYDRRAVDAYIERVNRVIAELKVRSSPPAAVRHALDQAEEKVQGLLRAAREAAEEITASARHEADVSTARAKAEAVKLVVDASDEADRAKAEADELIATARTDADETVAKAHTEADEMLVNARDEAANILARSRAEADERLHRSREELTALREEAETQMREIQADTEAVWKERRELLDDIRTMASRLAELANTAAARQPLAPKEETLKAEVGDEAEPSEVATKSNLTLSATVSHEATDEPGNKKTERTPSGTDA